MKTTPLYDSKFLVIILTHGSCDAKVVKKTIAHVYPNAVIEACGDEREFFAKKGAIAIIDTEAVPALPHILEKLSETPAILVVRDFSDIRKFSPSLNSLRSVVTLKDLEGLGLVHAIHHLMERAKLHEQLLLASRRLKELSIRDELTRLFNHRHFDEILAMEVKKANRYKRNLSLVIVALKNFTAINEALGHEGGDNILAKSSEIVRYAVREVDTAARYGDNEFALVLPEADETSAKLVAERIQEMLGRLTIETKDGPAPLVISAGIAELSSKNPTKDELLHTALGALIEAKRNSKSAICTSSETMAAKNTSRESRKLIEVVSERMQAIKNEAERAWFLSVIKMMNEILPWKKYVMPHSERVAFFAQRLAEKLGLGERKSLEIHRAGILHDAGKVAIDSGILTKAGTLSASEMEIMRRHPSYAAEIIGQSPLFAVELSAVMHHHERFDGTGYPDRIAGETISLPARILAIAEAWDTMISPQPYRTEPLPLDTALLELKKGAGAQFDPALVEHFVGLITG